MDFLKKILCRLRNPQIKASNLSDRLAEKNILLAGEEFKHQATVLNSLPSFVIIPCTDRCNLKCLGCGIGNDTGTTITITDQGFQRIFDIFPYITSVYLTGAEMFYDKGNPAGYVQKIFDEGEKYSHLKFVGITNATLINDDKAELIVNKFDRLTVSIDSPLNDKYAIMRGGANLDAVKENLRRVIRLKAARGLSKSDAPLLTYCFIIVDHTYKDLLSMVDFAYEFGGFGISFQAPWDGTFLEIDIFKDKKKTLEFIELRNQTEEKIKDLGMEVNDRTVNTIIKAFPELKDSLMIVEEKRFGEHPFCCKVPFEEIYIDPNGNVRVCCSSKTIIGNVNDNPIAEIWNSKEAVALRKRILSGSYVRDCGRICAKGILPS